MLDSAIVSLHVCSVGCAVGVSGPRRDSSDPGAIVPSHLKCTPAECRVIYSSYLRVPRTTRVLPAVTAARRSESELEEPRPRNIGLVPVAECAAGCAHGPRLSVTSKFGDQLRGLSRCPLASRYLLSLSPPLRRIVSPSRRSTAGRDHSDKFDCQWTAHDSDLSNSGPPGA